MPEHLGEHLTAEAKQQLSGTIRAVREHLLRTIHDEADRKYRLSLPIGEAGLDETGRKQRHRIEAWIDERARATKPKNKAELKATKDRLLIQAEKEAAATLVNRLVLLRHLEALGLSKPAVVTGGWGSKGYREFREFAPTLCTNGTTDATEGYGSLLQLLFDERAVDLPGLFGDVGLTRLFPIPAATLRDVVERLDDPVLASAWTDDTTLGWVYQYWNDPDREALDAKINDGGKIEPYEIASKTQMFTERYMVEWLLQNSLGLLWLAMCRKHGWTADADRVLPHLDARRAEWRKQREAGEVPLDALMPVEGELEDHWKYYVPQPIPEDAVQRAPECVRSIKILDPACGSGHFLVIAFGLLAALYRGEAGHLRATISESEIAESIVENNLFGIDIDPRAVQIAAAGLYLKAKSLAKTARPNRVNLVAPVLQLGNLPPDDPAVTLLRKDLKHEVGIPEELTTKLLSALAGVDYLGSLLKVDAAVEGALKDVELEFERTRGQGDFFGGFPAQQVKLSVREAKATTLDKLEQFLAKHSKSEDLGLRLDGEQLAAGIRFIRMAKEGTYDIVVGNPPYQGLGKTSHFEYIATQYPRGKADLYAAFLERAIELVRPGGATAVVTMRGWMSLGQFSEFRRHLLASTRMVGLGDLGTGAFSSRSMDDVISTALVVTRRSVPEGRAAAIQAGPLADPRRDAGKPDRRHAALLCHAGRYDFDQRSFGVIDGEPMVYWWSPELLARYAGSRKLAEVSPARFGVNTGDNVRFLRHWHEVWRQDLLAVRHGGHGGEPDTRGSPWAPFIGGAKGRVWFEELRHVVRWATSGLELHTFEQISVGCAIRNPEYQFRAGVAFAMIGSSFSARAHRFKSVFGDKGSSVFPSHVAAITCLLNTTASRFVLQSLNPSISFQVGDVNRIPVSPTHGVDEIWRVLETAFSAREAGREASIEFRRPAESTWPSAQAWAQMAIDRADGSPLPPYQPVPVPPASESLVSYAIGVALGRFGASGEGILDAAPASALPSGILFVTADRGDSLDHFACAGLHHAWTGHGPAVSPGDDLGSYLRKSFFDHHKKLYENRPLYFPLSSAKKSFVAFVSIHRWADDTLSVLLADHLVPTRRRLEGELDDLRTARATGNSKGNAEKRFSDVQKLFEELSAFIARVTEIADAGPPPSDDKTVKREVDARYVMDLDDGVMVNSAALWPLMEPQWKDPKKWWKELANATGKKDYDWSHLAARYFPSRVRGKCHADPSLAVAHKCFWELHPAKSYAWELRLQDEIRPDFTIEEPGSDAARDRFLNEHKREAEEALAKELKRRERKDAKAGDAQSEMTYEPAEEGGEADE